VRWSGVSGNVQGAFCVRNGSGWAGKWRSVRPCHQRGLRVEGVGILHAQRVVRVQVAVVQGHATTLTKSWDLPRRVDV